MPKKSISISFIGSGNVAYGLGMALKKMVAIDKVWSRKVENAARLASRLGCQPARILGELLDSDIVIVAVSDTAIYKVGEQWSQCLENRRGEIPIIAHTSGNIPSSDLDPKEIGFPHGVIYPLQTFTFGRRISLKKVPFFINGVDASVISKLYDLAGLVSEHVYEMGDEERKKIHLPAVIINNLVNHLIFLSEEVIVSEGLELEYFVPLMEETVRKINSIGPRAAQTGPARRQDLAVINAHLERLKGYGQLQKVYSLLSQSIIQLYHEDHR